MLWAYGFELPKAKAPSELLERVREEWEGSMQMINVFLSDITPAAAMKELMALTEDQCMRGKEGGA